MNAESMKNVAWCMGLLLCVGAALHGQPSRLPDNGSGGHRSHGPTLLDRLPSSVRKRFDAAELGDEALRVLPGAFVAGFMLGSAAFVLWGAVVSAVVVVVLMGGAVAALLRLGSRRQERLIRSLPTMVDSIGRSIRAGSSLYQAIAEYARDDSGPLATEIDLIMQAVERGQRLDDAIDSFAARVPLAQVRITATALALAAQNETGTTRALDGVAASLRDGASLRSETKALISQAQASMVVIAALPIAFLGFSALVDAQAATFLVAVPFGRFCLGAGLSLDVLGYLWMRRMIARVT